MKAASRTNSRMLARRLALTRPKSRSLPAVVLGNSKRPLSSARPLAVDPPPASWRPPPSRPPLPPPLHPLKKGGRALPVTPSPSLNGETQQEVLSPRPRPAPLPAAASVPDSTPPLLSTPSSLDVVEGGSSEGETADQVQALPPSPSLSPVVTSTATAREAAVVAEAVAETYSESESEDEFQSPSHLMYTEGREMPIVSRLHIVTPDEDTPRGTWPVFRLMDENGTFREPDSDTGEATGVGIGLASSPQPPPPARDDLGAIQTFLSNLHPHHADEFAHCGLLQPAPFEFADLPTTKNTLYRAFRQMVRLKEMDHILLNAQRQGRISFYMTCRGEEAIHMGSASALDPQDPVFAQYREQGLLMWRGFTLEQFTNQCFSNDLDLGKGRQMPIHYGSRALNYQTVSSPLGTQLPQAVGAAYRLKLAGRPNVAACFFGDGCASTTDFHSALNFAATLEAPVLFVCRNNGYAISTPIHDQYRGDGIVCRAPGYGMAGIRVDGNDVFAVHAAIREARRYALEHSAPVLVEAMTYRLGHHSTSDDSTRYRPVAQVADVAHRYDPIARLGSFLRQHGWLDETEETSIQDEERVAVLKAIEKAERRPPPPLEALFEDVYHDVPKHLLEQQSQLREHLAKYPKMYSTNPHHHHH